jgi:putative tryptophan/tyrosine transport system substrate-binding protein
MRRREFITLLGGAAAWPVTARAQQPAVPVVGFLHPQNPDNLAYRLGWWLQGLKEAGFIVGQNLAVEYRWANNRLVQLPVLAAELVRRRVDVIVANGGPEPAIAAKSVTSTIPIVFLMGTDPVKVGLVASLNRPGGNVTGVSVVTPQLAGKRLGLVRELVPEAMTIGFLHDPRTTSDPSEKSDMLDGARALGRQLIVVEARSDSDFDMAFATLVREHADALVVNSGVFFTSHRDKLVALSARHKIPAIYPFREFALDGGLMSYGAGEMDGYRHLAEYTARILKGAKPADLPVLEPTKFELVINLKTAKALGLTVPPALLATADEAIE